MKPREIINRTRNTYFWIVGVSFGLLVILAFADKYIPRSMFKMLATGAIVVCAVGVLLVYFGIRCPKCKAILGLKYVYGEEVLKRCSKCGIVFDDDSM